MKREMKGVLSALTTVLVMLLAVPVNADELTDSVQAVMKNNTGDVIGTITLEQTPSGVLLRGVMHNVPPGAHAFHVHETGNCDPATDFESAGGHLADGKQHGFLTRGGPHPGDMPNLHTNRDSINVEVFNPRISLRGDNTLLDDDGAALVLHADTDDYRSQPSGEAGARLACGVIDKDAGAVGE